jgi:hypothetical protein
MRIYGLLRGNRLAIWLLLAASLIPCAGHSQSAPPARRATPMVVYLHIDALDPARNPTALPQLARRALQSARTKGMDAVAVEIRDKTTRAVIARYTTQELQ